MQHATLFHPLSTAVASKRRAASSTTSLDKIAIELPQPRTTGTSKRLLARMSTIPSLVLHQIKGKPTQMPQIETSHNKHKPSRLLVPRTKRSRIFGPSTPLSPAEFLQYEIQDAMASSFTITLMDSPSDPENSAFSFTASPSSPDSYQPPRDSLVFQLPPPLPAQRERSDSMQTAPLPSGRRSSFDINGDHWFGPMTISVDGGEESSSKSETEDWRLFHVHFLQDDPPFLDTPA